MILGIVNLKGVMHRFREVLCAQGKLIVELFSSSLEVGPLHPGRTELGAQCEEDRRPAVQLTLSQSQG